MSSPKRVFPLWLSLPLAFVAIAVAGVVLPILLIFVMLGFLQAADQWDHMWLDIGMRQADILPPTSDESDRGRRQPDIVSLSPAGTWRLTASWVDHTGYAWALKNDRTGRVFTQETLKGDGCDCLPTRLSALWSPDGHYLAINRIVDGVQHFSVLHVSEDGPQRLDCSCDADSLAKDPIILPPGESAQGTWGANSRAKALGWMSNSELEVVVFLEVQLGKFPAGIEPYRVDSGANVVLKIVGNSVTVTQTKRDFYEKFITDL